MRAYTIAASASLSIIGLAVMFGWLFGIAALTSLIPGTASMKFNTALGLLCGGISLWLLRIERPNTARSPIGRGLAGLVTFLAAATLVEYVSGWDLRIDQLFVADLHTSPEDFPGRMSPISAFCLFMAGIALLTLDRRISQYLALLVFFPALLALLGYFYDFESLYRVAGYSSIALNSAIGFFMLSTGLLAARPGFEIMATLTSDGSGSRSARVQLPLALILLALLGGLVESLERAGVLDAGNESIVLTVLIILLYLPFIYFYAITINRSQEALRQSEERYRLISSLTSDYAYMDTIGPDGGITAEWITDSFTRITGYSIEETREPGFWMNVVHPDDVPILTQHISQILAGRADTAEFRVRTRDGETRWFKDFANPIHDPALGRVGRFYGAVQDITGQKGAETRFRLAVESAPNAIIMVDEAGKIVLFNAQAEKYFGYTRSEIAGKSIDLLVPDRFRGGHPGNRATFLAQPQARPMGGGRDLYALRKDGSEFAVEIGLAPLETTEGMLVMATIVDLTERKEAEKAALENEARYHHILDAMMEGCQIIDYDWRYVYVNDVVAAQGKRSRQELINHTMMEMYPGIENTELFVLLRECMTERTPRRMENQFVFPDGTIGWFELSIQPAREGVFILSTDITERKKAERQLEQQNRRLKALREIDSAILAADSVEMIVGAALSHILELIECRRASLALLEWEQGDALIFDVKAGNDSFMPKGTRVPLEVSPGMIPILEKNQPVVIDDLTALPGLPPQFQQGIKEGFRSVCVLPLFSHSSLIGMFNMSSETPGFFDEEKVNLGREVANQVAIAITQNQLIEDMRKLNEELEDRVRDRTLQLEAANRELEAFSYSVSHDLRAPLRAINGFSQALAGRHAGAIGEQGTHYLDRIQANTRRMGTLIDDLLSLSRISRREMKNETINLAELAHEIAGELHAQEPDRKVTFEIEDQVQGRGDGGLIRIILQNLLANAVKFTSSREQAQIQFGVVPPGRKGEEVEIVYYVSDNGVGFDMAHADKLFGAFQRLHAESEFPGTGIGLAIVQRIVHRHGGRIWVEAEPGKGAAFYFTLGGSHEQQ